MTLILPRRRFLQGLVGIIAAPAVVKAESLMRIVAPPKIIRVVTLGSRANLDTLLTNHTLLGWEEIAGPTPAHRMLFRVSYHVDG